MRNDNEERKGRAMAKTGKTLSTDKNININKYKYKYKHKYKYNFGTVQCMLVLVTTLNRREINE